MKTESHRGSALVFSLVVLSMILVAALGVASVSVVEKKNSSATGKSTQAFQVADSAVEVVLKEAVLDPSGTSLSALAGKLEGTVGCEGGVVSGSISGGSVELTFLDMDGNVLTDCINNNLSQVATVKSVGRAGDTTRAISSAVAAGTLSWTNATLTNGWNQGWPSDNYAPAGYAKDSRTGIVYLRGLVWHGTSSGNLTDSTSTIFNLPDDYTPSFRKTYHVVGNNVAGTLEGCRIDVLTSSGSGAVAPFGVSAKWCSLDGISFPTN